MGKKATTKEKTDDNGLLIISQVKGILEKDQEDVSSLEPKAVEEESNHVDDRITWERTPTKHITTNVECIVIDKNDLWNEKALVDLKGIDTSGFTWGYYGNYYPVLVEDNEGNLKPWFIPDTVGESSQYLYLAENPEGYKTISRKRNPVLEKVRLGLMAVLVICLFFIMYLFIDLKGG